CVSSRPAPTYGAQRRRDDIAGGSANVSASVSDCVGRVLSSLPLSDMLSAQAYEHAPRLTLRRRKWEGGVRATIRQRVGSTCGRGHPHGRHALARGCLQPGHWGQWGDCGPPGLASSSGAAATGQWAQVPFPSASGSLGGVAVVSDTDAWAVGAGNTVL